MAILALEDAKLPEKINEYILDLWDELKANDKRWKSWVQHNLWVTVVLLKMLDFPLWAMVFVHNQGGVEHGISMGFVFMEIIPICYRNVRVYK